jgi:hypothetical protein
MPAPYLASSYYLGLITSEYQLAPKFLAWLSAPLSKLLDASICLDSFTVGFDLDAAIGPQLDVLGQIIGQSRVVGFQPSNGISPTLNDASYRLLLKARIAQNQWQGTIDELQGIWAHLFPGGQIVVIDSQNMSATIILTGAFTSIVLDMIVNGYIVPRPEGVLYNYVFPVLPAFGFDQNTAYIAGPDRGHFI